MSVIAIDCSLETLFLGSPKCELVILAILNTFGIDYYGRYLIKLSIPKKNQNIILKCTSCKGI